MKLEGGTRYTEGRTAAMSAAAGGGGSIRATDWSKWLQGMGRPMALQTGAVPRPVGRRGCVDELARGSMRGWQRTPPAAHARLIVLHGGR